MPIFAISVRISALMKNVMAKKHKKKRIYTTSVTSNIASDKTKYYRTRFNVFRACIIVTLLVVAIGAFATWYVLKEFVTMEAQVKTLRETVSTQEATILDLGKKNAELESRNEILSVTVGKQQVENEEQEEIRKERAIPNGFPLTSSAEIEEQETDPEDEDYIPMVVFVMSEDSDVVATADGTVLSVREDSVYGNCVVIDHGNGYQTLYKNSEPPKVSEGDEVVRGAIIYVGTGDEENRFCYQITYLDQYTDPMGLIDIEG